MLSDEPPQTVLVVWPVETGASTRTASVAQLARHELGRLRRARLREAHRATRAGGHRRRCDRPDRPGGRGGPGGAATRPASDCSRRPSAGRVPMCSAARSPERTRGPARWRRCAWGAPIAYREAAVRGADGQPVRVAAQLRGGARWRDRPGDRDLRDISAVRALEELREGFVATVSHELRTPLGPSAGTRKRCSTRPRSRATAGVRGADRRGHRRLAIARRPGAGRHPPPGRSADPGPRSRRRSRRSSRACAVTSRSPAARTASSSRRRPTCRPSTSTWRGSAQILANLVGNALKYARTARRSSSAPRPTGLAGRDGRRRRRRGPGGGSRARHRAVPPSLERPGVADPRHGPRAVHLPAPRRGARRPPLAR